MIEEDCKDANLEQPAGLTLKSSADPLRKIILNRDQSKPAIIDRPPQEAVRELFESVEKHYISRFWEKVLCKPSPYFPKLPFALASWDKRRVTFSYFIL